MLSDLREGACAASDDLQCLQRKCRQIIERLDSHRQSLVADSHKPASAAVDKRFVVIATCPREKMLLFGIPLNRWCTASGQQATCSPQRIVINLISAL